MFLNVSALECTGCGACLGGGGGVSDSGGLGQGWGIFISSKFMEDAETLTVLERLFKAEGTPAEALRQERAWWVQGLERSPVWLEDKEQGTVEVGRGHAMR